MNYSGYGIRLSVALLLFLASSAWLPVDQWSERGKNRLSLALKDASEHMSQVSMNTTHLDHGNLLLPKSPSVAENMINGDGKPRREGTMESFDRAVQQVNALIELYKGSISLSSSGLKQRDSNLSGDTTISWEIVETALQSLVVGALTTHGDKAEPLGFSLKKLEDLVWRLYDVNLSPSLQLMDSLWVMHEFDLQFASEDKRTEEDLTMALSRAFSMLVKWFQISANPLVPPPPRFALAQILEYANREQHATLVWELYKTVHRLNQNEARIRVPRDFYTAASYFLIQDAKKHCRLLRDMVNLSVAYLRPTTREIEAALPQCVLSGLAKDVVWLICQLPEANSTHHQLFVQSLLYSNDPGSLHYMERYVQKHPSLVSYNMLLRKWSQARQPGSGMRAEASFRRMEASNVAPTMECVHSVLSAYLLEYSLSLSHVKDADDFVRGCVSKGYLRLPSTTTTRVYPLFNQLLEAYSNVSSLDPVGSEKCADELFQFFLIQHRNGNGTIAEEPGPRHLHHLLTLWKQLASSNDKSLEYWQLFNHLYSKGDISEAPGLDDGELVLKNLALSARNDTGDAAESIFRSYWNCNHTISASKTLSNMALLVVRCHSRTLQGVESAWQLIEDLDERISLGPIYHTLLRRQFQLGVRGCARVDQLFELVNATPSRWPRLHHLLQEWKEVQS